MKKLIPLLIAIAVCSPIHFGQEAGEEPAKSEFEKTLQIASKSKKNKRNRKKPKAPEKLGTTDAYFGFNTEFLTNDRGTWYEGRVDVVHKFTNRHVVYGTYRETERFKLRDREASVGLYQPIDDKWTVHLEASASPTNRVLPTWSGLVQAERSLGDGWIAKAGYRRTERTQAKVNSGRFGVEKYWGMNRAEYTFSVNNLEGTGTSPAQRIQYSRYYGSSLSAVNVSFTFGDEVEQISADTVLKSAIRNIYVNGRHKFNRQWGVTYGVGFHRQGQVYDRRGLNAGFIYQF